MSNYEGMRITIDCHHWSEGNYYNWRVVTDGDKGFYQSGRTDSYRKTCRQARRAMKKLSGIGFLPYQENSK